MKLKNILYYLAVIILLTPKLWATNTNPVVTNVTFSNTGTTVTVHYDVTDAEQSTVTISMEVSSDGGATWNDNFGIASGDIGDGVSKGNGKTITWTYSGGYNSNFKIMISANDGQVGGSDCGTVAYGGKTYTTIMIGNQCWLKENLDVGTQIGGSANQTNNSLIEKYCYNDDPANCTTYGGLYQWNEVMQYVTTQGARGICPIGWHLPTNAEYQTLATTVSNNGNTLKAVGQDGTSTNTSGFSALLAGDGGYGYFYGLGVSTYFWSSAEYDATNAYNMYLIDYFSNINLYFDSKEIGFSVRCAKDF